MEADWEIEIGPEARVIDAAWSGYVDLGNQPERIGEIVEAARFAALAEALVRLNSPSSPVRTVKCDVWAEIASDAFDPDEMDADPENMISALASYVDIMPAECHAAPTLDAIVDWCKKLCSDLRLRQLSQCRLDAIVRRAFVTADREGLGITAYLSACATSPAQASEVLSRALAIFADAVVATGGVAQQASKYNQSVVGE